MKDIQGFTAFINEHLDGEHSFKLFFDLRKATEAPPKVIAAMTKYMLASEQVAVTKVVASSIVVGKKSTENLLNMLFSINAPATPTKITADIEAACNFLNEFEWLTLSVETQ